MDVPKKTESEQIEFFNQCLEKFQKAVSTTNEIKHFFNIGGMKVCLSFAGETLVPYLTPALEHLRIPETNTPDATICVWESETTAVKMVPPPCERKAFTDRGDIWGFTSERIKTAFHWGEFSVNVMDLESNTGIYWVETAKKIPYWVFSSPFRTMFHWLMEKNNCQLLHAAAVGTKDGAVLISGKGGMGKSSTSIICLENGFYYVGDDYVIVKSKPEPTVYSLYSTAKINTEDIDKFPFYKPHIKTFRNFKQEKAVLFLHPDLKNQILTEMPLKAIFTPEIHHRKDTRISDVSHWHLSRAMAFTTMSQLPYVGKHTHEYINELCESLPGFTLELGSDFADIPKVISNYIAKPESYLAIKAKPEASEQKPLVSVIVPVYNGEKFIEEAIENILSQNYPALEIIIVNDGSTDNSEEIIKNLPIDIRYFYQENDGPSSARNRGIRDVSGEFIAFLDVDDLWPENNLNLLVDILQKNPDILVVHGFAQILEKNETSGKYDYAGNPKESFPGYIGAGLYRKEAFNEVGLFDEFMKFGEDSDWFKRAEELNINLKKLEEVTLFVRRHENNMTKGKSLVELNALKVFKKSLDRVRQPHKDRKTIPEISVIIPVYNTEKYIGEAIESVLNQSVKPMEIIIVDDGSIDNSVKEIEKFGSKVKLVQQENKGAAAARNLGVEMSKGVYLSFLDADDFWTQNHQDVLLNAFDKDPNLEMAFGMVEQFISPELIDSLSHLIRNDLKILPGYHLGSMLIKRNSYLKVGDLNENLQLAEFIDWFARAKELNINTKMIDKVVYKRRIHTTNQGVLKKEHLKDYTSVLKEALKRKRENK